jgi:hypothetical protein
MDGSGTPQPDRSPTLLPARCVVHVFYRMHSHRRDFKRLPVDYRSVRGAISVRQFSSRARPRPMPGTIAAGVKDQHALVVGVIASSTAAETPARLSELLLVAKSERVRLPNTSPNLRARALKPSASSAAASAESAAPPPGAWPIRCRSTPQSTIESSGPLPLQCAASAPSRLDFAPGCPAQRAKAERQLLGRYDADSPNADVAQMARAPLS